jgi:hypothetical protein
VCCDLYDAELAVVSEATEREAALLEGCVILGIHAVIAAIIFDNGVDTIERRSPCARDDRDRLLRPDNRAGQGRDDQPLGIRAGLSMISVLESEDVARELDDRVLEAASGSKERHPALAGEPDGRERALHAPIRTGRRNDETGVRGQALLWPLGHHFDGRNPLEVKTGVSKRLVRGLMRLVLRVEVSDNPNLTPLGFHATPPECSRSLA